MVTYVDGIPHKRCFKCGETKPCGEFYRDARSPDGLQGPCAKCQIDRLKQAGDAVDYTVTDNAARRRVNRLMRSWR